MESNFVVERKDIKEAGLTEIFNKETKNQDSALGEILFITSYPPRECGIASYSQNLINALNSRFINNYSFNICALESGGSKYYYPPEVKMVLNIADQYGFSGTLKNINNNPHLKAVVIQHEFDLFGSRAVKFSEFIKQIEKPVITIFHTVVRNPGNELKRYVKEIAAASRSIIVLAEITESILVKGYGIAEEKIEVIPYGTHLIKPSNASALKEKYKLSGKSVISTIGMLSPSKGIETTLEALPAVIKEHPGVIFLVIGKTHPEEIKKNGENYRVMLEGKVKSLKLQNHVQFLNVFFTTEILQEYFQLSDICIFSGKDPNRPASGMFAFAVSCGCPIISSPALHAYEFLSDNAGFIYENQSSGDLSSKIIQLLGDPALRESFSENILKKSLAAIWENSALLHQSLFNKISGNQQTPNFSYPDLNLDFLKSMTDRVGMLHSSQRGEPDIRAGYYLDDNAMALFVFCMHYKITGDINDLTYIRKYLKFVYHCYQPSGLFLKYVDRDRRFTSQNYSENLEETQGKAIWALGYLYSMKGLLPSEMTDVAGIIMDTALPLANNFTDGKSIAFVIKGLYYYYSVNKTPKDLIQIKTLQISLWECTGKIQMTTGNGSKINFPVRQVFFPALC